MSCILIPFPWGWINPSFPVVWQQKMLMGLWQGRREMGRGKLQRYITGIRGLSGQELKVLEFQYLFYLCHHLWDEANHINSLFCFCHLQNGDNVAPFAPTWPDTFLYKLFLNPTEAKGAMPIHIPGQLKIVADLGDVIERARQVYIHVWLLFSLGRFVERCSPTTQHTFLPYIPISWLNRRNGMGQNHP